MNPTSFDIKDILEVSNLGTYASSSDWGIFIGAEPEKPLNCITILDTPGLPPGRYADRTQNPSQFSEIQIRVRGESYLTAWSKINTCAQVLEQRGRFTVNDTRYANIVQVTDFIPLENMPRRCVWAVNFRCYRESTQWIPPYGVIAWYSAYLSGDVPALGAWIDKSVSSVFGYLKGTSTVQSSVGVYLNGSSDYVDLFKSSAFLNKNEVTFCAWVQALDFNTNRTILHIADISTKSGGVYDALTVDVTTAGKIRVRKWIDGTYYEVLCSTTLTAGVWYHIIVMVEGSAQNIKVFVDTNEESYTPSGTGRPVGFTSDLTFAAIDHVVFGVYWDSDGKAGYLKGTIDEIMLFNRAISSSERSLVFAGDYKKK